MAPRVAPRTVSSGEYVTLVMAVFRPEPPFQFDPPTPYVGHVEGTFAMDTTLREVALYFYYRNVAFSSAPITVYQLGRARFEGRHDYIGPRLELDARLDEYPLYFQPGGRTDLAAAGAGYGAIGVWLQWNADKPRPRNHAPRTVEQFYGSCPLTGEPLEDFMLAELVLWEHPGGFDVVNKAALRERLNKLGSLYPGTTLAIDRAWGQGIAAQLEQAWGDFVYVPPMSAPAVRPFFDVLTVTYTVTGQEDVSSDVEIMEPVAAAPEPAAVSADVVLLRALDTEAARPQKARKRRGGEHRDAPAPSSSRSTQTRHQGFEFVDTLPPVLSNRGHHNRTLSTIGHGVAVGPSALPGAGLGLFAGRDFEKGDYITYYDGRIIRAEDATERRLTHGAHHHIITVGFGSTGFKIDGITVPVVGKGGASFANDCEQFPTSARRTCENNARRGVDLADIGGRPVPALVATRDIRRGEEILWGYMHLSTQHDLGGLAGEGPEPGLPVAELDFGVPADEDMPDVEFEGEDMIT